MKAADDKSSKTEALKDSIYMFHCCNKALKYLPSIIFTILYVFSSIDLIPEAILGIWIGYCDDVMLVIAVSVYIYCGVKGLIKENDPKTEREESIYSHIVRNSGGSIGDTLGGKIYSDNSCVNNSGSDNDVHTDACEGNEYSEKPQIDKLIEEIDAADKSGEVGETEKVGESNSEETASENRKENTRKRSVYSSRREEIKSEEDMQREFSQENRSTEFTIEEDEILW
ncbi:MAG: DUF1232 domain-containing protein [Firmicutes bacterium]|nr:DUF1232 domain-containing protein [Bacillota bacterium]